MKSCLVVNVLLLSGLCGCAHLATVKTTRAPIPAASGNDDQHAREYLVAAERQEPLVALGNDLSAAKLSLSVLEQRPSDSSAQSIYNFSVARAVENIERANIQPWRHQINVVGDQRSYMLTTPKPIDPEHDPSRYDVSPTDSLKISGRFFETRSSINGIGAPLVAAFTRRSRR